MTATTEAWREFCLIGILSESDANEVQFAGMTEDITAMDWGEKDIQGVPLLNGGRIVKKVPMTDEKLTLKVVPVTVNRDGTGIEPYLSGTVDSASDPFSVLNSNARERHRIVLVWAETLPDTASGTIAAGGNWLRVTIVNAYCTSVKPSYSDKYMSGEISFKWAPFTKSAVANRKVDSGETLSGTAVTATATSL